MYEVHVISGAASGFATVEIHPREIAHTEVNAGSLAHVRVETQRFIDHAPVSATCTATSAPDVELKTGLRASVSSFDTSPGHDNIHCTSHHDRHHSSYGSATVLPSRARR